MSQNNNFLAIPDEKDLFVPVKNESNSPVDDEDEENKDDSRLIPRSSPVPRKRGPSIADETAEYMRIRNHFKRRVSFADSTGGDLIDVREFNAFDEDEDTERWEAEEARYRTAIREPTYRLSPEFQELSGDELMRAVRAGKVEVQRVSFDADEPLEFSGTIRVLNISFSKSVYIRSTMDGWGTYFDYPADYVEDSNDGESDQFSFKLSFAPPFLFDGARIDFVVRYETSNGDFWANNSGKNYSVTLHVTYEDPFAQASGIDVHSLRGILKPGKEYEYDSEDDDDEGPRRLEPEERPRPVQPVIVHPEMDIDVGVQEQGSLSSTSTSTSTSDHVQITVQTTTTTKTTTITTKEGSACSSIATEFTPTAPATEMSPADQQDTTTQANASLPLSEPEQEFGSEINHPLQTQQETEPAVQEEVEDGDVTAIPACHGVIPALTPAMPPSETSDVPAMPPSETSDVPAMPPSETSDVPAMPPSETSDVPAMPPSETSNVPAMPPSETSDVPAMPPSETSDVPAMPPSETSDVDPILVVATDIPHQLELPELAAPPLPLDQEIDVNREEDAGVTFAEKMEEFEGMEEEFEMEVEVVGGVDEELREIEEETDTSERLEGSERSAITEQKSPASSHSLEERVSNESAEDIGEEIAPLREHADLKEVPQVRPRPLTSTDDSSSRVEISGGPELRLREESAQAAGEDVSSSVMSHSFPTYRSPIHPGPTGEDCKTQSRLSLSDTISDAAKSLTSLQHPKPCKADALEESSATLDSEYTNHEVLTVTSVSRPVELESEKIASPQYFSITAQATTPSARNAAHGSGEGRLNVSDGTEELGSLADVSDGTEELGSLADVSYPPCMSILSSEVSEDALDQPVISALAPDSSGISALAPDSSISIGRTLRPAAVGLSVVVCLIAALQEPSLFFVLGLSLVVHCF
ncbi:flocculation protein FLO11 isoform X2 [Clupea harengus]|uniref:Flocculation protein FLO11 isoform X2 n=1 Tax=Clupea harengus TaxID=7950 RepID=A0A6P3VN35_CLUHA|nr:flocculation protein FLO11 isoform X2 [Clupea harengus]